MREFATTDKRQLTGTEINDLGKNVRRIEALKRERRTATASRIGAIDAEVSRLNEQCETLIQSRG
jgi:hypothetical protein